MRQRIQFNLPFSFYRNEHGILAFDMEDQFAIGPEDEPVAICGCRVVISMTHLSVSNSGWLNDGGLAAFISCCERQLRSAVPKKPHRPARLSPLEHTFRIQLQRTAQDWRFSFKYSDGLCDSKEAGYELDPAADRAAYRLKVELKKLWVKEADVVDLIRILRRPLEAPLSRY